MHTYGKNNVILYYIILFSIRNIEINLTVGHDFYLIKKKSYNQKVLRHHRFKRYFQIKYVMVLRYYEFQVNQS